MSDHHHKVLVLATGDDLVGAFRTARAGLPGVELEIGPMRPAKALAGTADAPEVLVVEVDAGRAGAIDAFQSFARSLPDRKIIAAARAADAEQVRRLFRAGAADVVAEPFTSEALTSALSELLATGGLEQGAGKTIAVIKAGGGAGATLFAVNLAVLLQRSRPTALLDLDLQFGDAAAVLDLQPRSTLLDLLRAKDRFDGRFLEGVMSPHDSGLRVLAAPNALVPASALDAGFAEALMRTSASVHPTTVVDLPGFWGDWTLPVLRRADLVVLVTRPSVSGALRARRVLDAFQEAGLTAPVFFVLNGGAGALEGMERAQRIGKSLERPVDAALSSDTAAGRAADRGRPVVDAFPNSRLGRELRAAARKLEQRLTGEEPEAAPALAPAVSVLRPFAKIVRPVGAPA